MNSQVSTPQQMHYQDDDLIVRTAQTYDAHMIYEYFTTNREFLKPWEPKREDEFFTISGWTVRLIKLDELHKRGLGYYILVIDKPSGKMLGTISFSNITRFPLHSCNLGYSLAESAQGKGYMTRALQVAIDYMFEVQNIHRISAGYMPHNHRSEAVLKRLGFEREGYAKDFLLIDQQWQDHVITGLINPNWKLTQ